MSRPKRVLPLLQSQGLCKNKSVYQFNFGTLRYCVSFPGDANPHGKVEFRRFARTQFAQMHPVSSVTSPVWLDTVTIPSTTLLSDGTASSVGRLE